MKPKEKAEELVRRYDLMQTYIEGFGLDNSKECALIAVDEILYSHSYVLSGIKPSVYNYFKEVKEEIENIK